MKRAERQTEELMRDTPIDDFLRSLGEAGGATNNTHMPLYC